MNPSILVWGESDFSLTKAIIDHYQSDAVDHDNSLIFDNNQNKYNIIIVGTTYLSIEDSISTSCWLSDTASNMKHIVSTNKNNKDINCNISFGIDATNNKQNYDLCHSHNNSKRFDRIFFAFPRHSTQGKDIDANSNLVNQAFKTAQNILHKTHGIFYVFLHVSKKLVSQKDSWKLDYDDNWLLIKQCIKTRSEMKQIFPDYTFRCHDGREWTPDYIAVCGFQLKSQNFKDLEEQMIYTLLDIELMDFNDDTDDSDDDNYDDENKNDDDSSDEQTESSNQSESEDEDDDDFEWVYNVRFTDAAHRQITSFFGPSWVNNESFEEALIDCIQDPDGTSRQSNNLNWVFDDDCFKFVVRDPGTDEAMIVHVERS